MREAGFFNPFVRYSRSLNHNERRGVLSAGLQLELVRFLGHFVLGDWHLRDAGLFTICLSHDRGNFRVLRVRLGVDSLIRQAGFDFV